MIDTYTKLLEVAAESGDPKTAHEAVIRLVHHLKVSGKLKMLPSIAHELRKIRARRHALAPKVEVADTKDAKEALRHAHELGITAEVAEVNAALLSGWRAQGKGLLVDRSGKRALIDIYKKVIA